MIPHSKPLLDEDDVKAVSQVIRSGQVAQGPKVAAFELELSKLSGKSRVVAVSSGTSAIHLALIALGAGPGKKVAMPSFVCSSLYHATTMAMAEPLIIDIDPATFQMDPADLNKKVGPEVKAIIIPHPFGLPADLAPFKPLGIPIVEDCAQAVGGPVGFKGDVSIFSFYATKVLAAGEGGAVCSDDEIVSKVIDMRGYDNRDDLAQRFNYKMTDIQAALASSQLKKLPEFVRRRREIARFYDERFAFLPITLPLNSTPAGESVYHRYIVGVPEEVSAEAFIQAMAEASVSCARPVYKPLHRYLGLDGFDGSDRAWERSVSIPLYPAMTDREVEIVASSVLKLFNH